MNKTIKILFAGWLVAGIAGGLVVPKAYADVSAGIGYGAAVAANGHPGRAAGYAAIIVLGLYVGAVIVDSLIHYSPPKDCCSLPKNIFSFLQENHENSATPNYEWTITNQVGRDLCMQALVTHDKPLSWDKNTAFQKFVTEAERRGYTPERCAAVVGRKHNLKAPSRNVQTGSSTSRQHATIPKSATVQRSIDRLKLLVLDIKSAKPTEELQQLTRSLYTAVISGIKPAQPIQADWGN